MRMALASDHRGFKAKELVKNLLKSRGIETLDFGCNDQNSCDYPDTGLAGAQAVADGRADNAILMCGTGIGMSITANKVKGIRAALCHDEMTTQLARRHNNANVLCLPADLIGDELIRRVVDIWLTTHYEGGRHDRRLQKIAAYEMNGQALKEPSA
jgi:ribose 5-phosphate isomerase B